MTTCNHLRKIALYDVETDLRPQIPGGLAEEGVEFYADGTRNLLAEYGKRSRIETARADGRIGKPNCLEPITLRLATLLHRVRFEAPPAWPQ